MWQVLNRTPFAASGYFVRDREGFEHWAVAVRAHFKLVPAAFPCLEEQHPVRLAPTYTGPDALELRAETDLSPFRPRPDVVLHGHAVVARGGLADRQLLRLRLGQVEKRVHALGPRRARRHSGGWTVDRAPFGSFPLSWRHSLGGPDILAPDIAAARQHPRNPIGIGWSPSFAHAPEGTEFDLPQLEQPDARLHPDRPLPLPTGFGPVQPGWEPRLSRAGTYDAAWLDDRAPLPPADLSDDFHQAAPDDQVHPGPLRGGEPLELEGFHPEGSLSVRLPAVVLRGWTRIGRSTVDCRFRLVAVEIDATALTLDMVWNMSVPCPAGDHLVERSNISLQQMSGVAR